MLSCSLLEHDTVYVVIRVFGHVLYPQTLKALTYHTARPLSDVTTNLIAKQAHFGLAVVLQIWDVKIDASPRFKVIRYQFCKRGQHILETLFLAVEFSV